MTRKLYEPDGTPRAVAVVGPTASGKTAFAISLCERFGGEVVGCDSMQIYRRMSIGTAKPSEAERARVPHHLVDFLSPSLSYSAADYAEAAKEKVSELTERGILPVFCGGTGLYLEAARSGRHTGLPPVPDEIRAALVAEAETVGAEVMHAMLAEVDPPSAEAIHPNNVRRVLRALEIYRTTGKPKSLWDKESRQTPPAMRLLVLGLFPTDREVLRARIDRRVDAMVAAGLREEVYALYRDGLLQKGSTAAEAIGYKEYLAAFSGACSEEEAVAEIKYATHRYARRQLTWFRAIPGILPLPCGEEGITEEGWERALRLTNEFLCCE